MAKVELDTVEGAYRIGRTYPGGRRPHDVWPKVKARAYEQPDPKQQAVQDPEAKHGPGYDNEPSIKSWVRGYGKPHPHFDHSPPRSKTRR